MARFEEWKQGEEESSSAYFVTQRAPWINDNIKYIYVLYCNRYVLLLICVVKDMSRQFNSRGTGKHELITQGTLNIHNICTAQ